ncbi:MAG TPA: hypothetical protein VN442_00060, partial [Bryobacteraceae bacterium]|nr:hypothetical protein [Bryobacteraceae bacterium]
LLQKSMTSWVRSQRRTRIVCGVLALVLLAISAYVFSGFHTHDPRSTKVCSFAQFEHGSSLEPAGDVDLCPPAACRWRPIDVAAELPHILDGALATGRAPPSCC